METYEFQPIRVDDHLHILINVTIHHPLRYHHKPILGHRNAKQGEHVRVIEGPPRHNLPAEPLQDMGTVSHQYSLRYRQEPTRLINSRPSLEYTLKTLAATS